ncbi:MAG: hypothetical protein ACYDB7_12035 [Mycobacteriales bacterium]
MPLGGAFSIIAIIAAGVVLLPLLLGGVFVVVIVANRADPDPSGRRPGVVYAFGIAFVTLFVTLFATAGLIASLCQLIGAHGGTPQPAGIFGSVPTPQFGSTATYGSAVPFGSAHPIGDAVARGSTLSVIIALVAGLAFALHLTAAARSAAGAPAVDPVARVRASYVAAVAFLSVLIAVLATVVALYDVFRLIAPGVFSPNSGGERVAVLRTMLPMLYLAAAAVAVLLAHLRHAPESLRRRTPDSPTAPNAPAAAEPPAAEPPAAYVLEADPPPRRRPATRKPPPAD